MQERSEIQTIKRRTRTAQSRDRQAEAKESRHTVDCVSASACTSVAHPIVGSVGGVIVDRFVIVIVVAVVMVVVVAVVIDSVGARVTVRGGSRLG